MLVNAHIRIGRLALAAACVALCCAGIPAAAGEPGPTSLGNPGYLILAGAADSTAGYSWRSGPGPGQRSLVWEHGLLTLPASLQLEGFGPRDLAVAAGAGLTGTSGGGVLVFADGRYDISAPLLLTDGSLSLYAADGELEIIGSRLRYTPPRTRDETDPRAGYIFLAGMVLLVVVLLRAARRRQRQGTGS